MDMSGVETRVEAGMVMKTEEYKGETAVKLQEYATEAQIEFFNRLRSGDDPVHKQARTELVKLAHDTLQLLYSLFEYVKEADHDDGVPGVVAKLNVIAGNEVELFTLDISTDGYDVSTPI
jgi:hypothetical protein